MIRVRSSFPGVAINDFAGKNAFIETMARSFEKLWRCCKPQGEYRITIEWYSEEEAVNLPQIPEDPNEVYR